MSAPHIILNNLPSLCQKLSDLVEVLCIAPLGVCVWSHTNADNLSIFDRF